ncbi:MAG TPA: FAD-binding protein [Candidatus Hydrogenedentes bacterium]|nr:FAD-binding protein [Candidatus Hydrogenedentota bacterium]
MADASRKRARLEQTDCDVRFDALTRALFATDASIYQIEPFAVAFPRSAAEAASAIAAAAEAGVPITPRGAGTGLAGGAVGSGLIVDFSRYNRRVFNLDLETRTVCVEPGVVLDQLNTFLKPHNLWFGPDVATSSRATLGGMISSNSSGARAGLYGTTVDNVASLEIVLADGTIATVGRAHDALPELSVGLDHLLERHAPAIAERCPPGLLKRWPGYGLDRYLHAKGDLTRIVGGSEGTLAAVTSAKLELAPLPARKGIGLVFFASVAEAMQATVELIDLDPVAIEHIDRLLFDQTAGQPAFRTARDFLQLDDQPCESILIIEFYNEIEPRLAALTQRDLGLRTLVTQDERLMEEVWALRKAGLSLLTSCPGPAKPAAGIEDAAIRPERLPAYLDALRALLEPLGLDSSFYGHTSAGLLHVRPVIDFHKAEDVAKYRQLAEGVSNLVREFGGSLCAEHGVGIARTEFIEKHLGTDLVAAMAEVKALFDPRGVMNPGKIVPDGSYHIDTHLRQGAGHRIELPFEPMLAFARKDQSFVGNLEQCNGCGQCRKDTPAMCPTFVATAEEKMTTRGRANAIRAVLEGRLVDEGAPLASAALDEALSNCLACKACKTECPSNVDLALLKSELIYARQRSEGVSLLDRVISSVDMLGRLGCLAPRFANAALRARPVRWLMEKALGIAAQRPLPPYTAERFDRWFAKRRPRGAGPRGQVILWDDCFVRYNEPHIGKAAVAVLEAAGFEVVLPKGRKCCGRPAFSRGRLDVAARLARHNLRLLKKTGIVPVFETRQQPNRQVPILFLEPSCYSMFVEDYIELRIDEAADVAQRCFLFEQFIYDLLDAEPGAIAFREGQEPVALHVHCHAKALTDPTVVAKLAAHLPDTAVQLLDTGCCGMAGAFGMLESKYALSLEVAKPLVDIVNGLPEHTRLVASGTSCRQQIGHLTKARPLHMAELFARALREPPPLPDARDD